MTDDTHVFGEPLLEDLGDFDLAGVDWGIGSGSASGEPFMGKKSPGPLLGG
jgi:hypothetical protein